MIPDELMKIVCEQTNKEMLERYESPVQLFDVTDTIYRECQKQFENEVALVVGHSIGIEKLDAERLKKALEFDRNCHRELVEKIEQLEKAFDSACAHLASANYCPIKAHCIDEKGNKCYECWKGSILSEVSEDE